MISVNQIYSYVEAELTALRPGLYCASRLEPVPPNFPSVEIVEINHQPIQRTLPLTFGQHETVSLRRDFEAHVFSNLKNGALSEARDIMSDVETAFREMYFVETYCGQTTNADPQVIHLVARFTRNIGDGDALTIE